jgi:HEAT repeat protein
VPQLPADEAVAGLTRLDDGLLWLPRVVAVGDAAVPALEALLTGPPDVIPWPRCLAADALAAIGSASAPDVLLRALQQSVDRQLSLVLKEAESTVISRIARHLGAFRDPRIADALLQALHISCYPGCAETLGKLNERRALPLLIDCLADGYALGPVMEALKRFGEEAVPLLIERLGPPASVGLEGDTPATARAAGATVLGQIGGTAAIAALSRALADPQRVVRRAAALALAASQSDPSAAVISTLAALLDEEDDLRAEIVERALLDYGARATLALEAAARSSAADAGAARRRKRALRLLRRLHVAAKSG